MTRWVEVFRADDLLPGEGRTVLAGDFRLAVFNHDGQFFAIDDACPHQGGPLGEGLFHEGRVICPWHSWVFDVRSGACPRGSHGGVKTYPTRRADGAVEVQLPAAVE